MGNQNSEVIFFVIILIIILIISAINHSDAKDTIKVYLQKRRAKNIIVFRDWLDFDRDTLTFLVEFTRPSGKKVSTRCKIRRKGIFLDKEIFWADPIEIKESKK